MAQDPHDSARTAHESMLGGGSKTGAAKIAGCVATTQSSSTEPCPIACQIRVPTVSLTTADSCAARTWACEWPKQAVATSAACPPGWSGSIGLDKIYEVQNCGTKLQDTGKTSTTTVNCTRIQTETSTTTCPLNNDWTGTGITYTRPVNEALGLDLATYGHLTVELWGGGGGGGGGGNAGGDNSIHATDGTAGTASTFLSLTAGGGAGGPYAQGNMNTGSAPGGGASGGDVNLQGGNGVPGYGYAGTCHCSGAGGTAPSGGAGGAGLSTYASSNGNAGSGPGGGGGGAALLGSHIYSPGGGAGAGGYVRKTYTAGQLTVGQKISFTIGRGGIGGNLHLNGGTLVDSSTGGSGAPGAIRITWTCN